MLNRLTKRTVLYSLESWARLHIAQMSCKRGTLTPFHSVVFVGPALNGSISSEVRSLLQGWGTDWVEHVSKDSHKFQPGPHIAVGKALWRVSRLYDDIQNTFLITVKGPNTDGEFELLNDGKHGWYVFVETPPYLGHHIELFRRILGAKTGLLPALCSRNIPS